VPRLTIGMPYKGDPRWLRKAVLSTLRSAPRDSELFVFDDVADHPAEDALDGVRDRRLKIRRGAKSAGVASVLNEVLATTDSDLFARMDADDICLPWRFALQSNRFARGDADVLFGCTIEIGRGHPKLAQPMPGPIKKSTAPLHLLLGNIFMHPTMFASRSAMTRMHGYRAVGAEDYDLWLRSVTSGLKLARVGVPVILYRHHDNQVTSAARMKSSDELLETYQAAYAHILGEECTPSLARMILATGSVDPGLRLEWAETRRLMDRRADETSRPGRLLLNARIGRRERAKVARS
jgi:hypothetical protein